MQLSEAPPRDWDARAVPPTLSRGFAMAAAAAGHRTIYVDGGIANALVLVRTLPVPVMRSWTARAMVYVSGGDADFMRVLMRALAARRIVHACVADPIAGLPRQTIERAGIMPVVAYRLGHSMAETERQLFQRLSPRRRRALRRARHAGIVVSEIRSPAELRDYCAMAGHTDGGGAGMPAASFAAIFGTMVPRGQAVVFLARRGDQPLAGAIFLTSPDRMTFFHAVSTSDSERAVSVWDPDLVELPGSTAVLWHAMKAARARGVPRLDLGTVSAVEDRRHPHFSIDHFRRSFGGTLEPLHHGEVTLSRLKHAFQERLMRRSAWKRAHDIVVLPFDPRTIIGPTTAGSGTDARRPAARSA